MDKGEMRGRVAEACRVLGLLDITKSTFGHVSARLTETDRMLIRARGPAESGVRYTTAEDVIEIDFNGQRVDDPGDGYRVPLEVFIHTEIYRSRPEVNAVVHVHPEATVLMTVCNKPLLPIYGAYDPRSLSLVLDGVPTYEHSFLIDRKDLGRELAQTMGQAPVCLMRGHGITTAANSIEEAALFAIHINDLAAMNYKAHLLGHPTPIPVEEQEAFRKMELDIQYGKPKVGVPSGRAANLWTYYSRLAKDLCGNRG